MKCVFLCICKIVGGRTKPLLEEGVFPLNTIDLTSQIITLLVFKIIFYIKYDNFNEFILCIQLNNWWIEASRELNLFTPVLNICLASCQLTVWMGTWRRWKVVRLSVKKSRPIWRSPRPLSLTLVDQTTRRNQRKNCLKWRGS